MYGQQEILDCLAELSDLGVTADEALAGTIANALGGVFNTHKAAYDGSWEALLKVVTTASAETADGTLAQALERIEARCADRFPEAFDPSLASQIKVDLGPHAAAPAGHKLVARDNRYALVPKPIGLSWTASLLKPFVAPDTSAIVEFGGGWGRNIAFLARDLPGKDRLFVNCEQSSHGRAASEALLGGRPGIRFEAREFHFETPDMDFLDDLDNLLVFTGAAIEQITFLHRSFLERILSRGKRVTLVMVEPFGWQRFTNLNRFVLMRFIAKCLGRETPEEAAEEKNYVFRFADDRFHDNAASWALGFCYNMNLLRMAGRFAEQGGAKLIDLRYDVYSENPLNPYSVMALRSA
jgi:hypothetical protein